MVAGTKRILVVEDSESILGFIKVYFTTIFDWEVVVAHNAAEALQAFEVGRFDMLLADINLDPHINGIELAKRLREQQKTLEVLLMGGDRRDSATAKEAGFDDFLLKPFELPTLGEACAKVIGRARGRDSHRPSQ
jgi:DNA-binding response OmpR family regulator